MRSQNQYTIYSLNDVVTQTTAPSNPYKGQLWVDTSQSPPVTKVYNGSVWKEQNGTDTLRSNISTLTTKQSSLETSLSGLTSTVSSVKKTVETIENDVEVIETNITNIESSVSLLEQTAEEISAEVSSKVDSTYGSSSSSFGWKLQSSGFYIYSGATTVLKITSSGLEVKGKITSSNGTLGGFTLDNNSLHIGTYGTANSIMLCTGTSSSKSIGGSASISGWAITAGTQFGVTKSGDLYANSANITGEINATSGYFDDCVFYEGCAIYGYMYMSGAEDVKFYGSKCTMYYDTWIGGTGISTEISQTVNGVGYCSYSYIRPFGMTIVPAVYSAFANDGMIFGIMQTYSFKTQHLLAGVSYYYSNDGTNIFSECLHRCGDTSYIAAYIDTESTYHEIYWGSAIFSSYMYGNWMIYESLYTYGANSYIASKYYSSNYYGCFYGRWYFDSYVYFGSATYGYLYSTTQNSSIYPYLAGTWYGSTLYMGSYTSYRTRLDSDQLTFYYNGSYIGELEGYMSYVDIQGTWKTNGSSWISSSDRNLKMDIKTIDDVYSKLFDKLKPVTFKWINGTSGRTHTGFVAQDVKQATEDVGLTTTEFAAYVHFDSAEKDGETIAETCGIRYEEITALNTWEIQKLKARVVELEEKIKSMEVTYNETN